MACDDSINGGYTGYVFADVRPNLVGGGKSLKEMTKVEIYKIAKSMEINGRSTMAKADLFKAVRRIALSRKSKASSSSRKGKGKGKGKASSRKASRKAKSSRKVSRKA